VTRYRRAGREIIDGMEQPLQALFCVRCLRDARARLAWTVADGEAKCIWHAVEWFDIEGDTNESALFEDLYLELRRFGFQDTH
jgi:hypothetical protein